MTALVLGIVGLNLVFALVGWALLHGLGRRLSVADAGLALVLGTGVAGTGVFLAVIAGARANLRTLAVVCVAIALAAGAARGRRLRHGRVERPDVGVAAAALLGVVAAVCALAVVGGFRSSPWLDDAWGIWLPKGVTLLHRGLDTRVFAPSDVFVSFEVLDYPLWWSSITALDVRAVGSIDLRALNAQLGLLSVGFVGAVAVLLWGRVRPWLIGGTLALVVASPEFFRHSQGGVADLALAIYLSLATLCAVVWLAEGDALLLVLAALFGAVAVQVKTEGLAELLVLLAVGVAAGAAYAPARARRLAVAGLVSAATALPWLVWRAVHDVDARVPLTRALDPTYLADRADRVGPAARSLTRHVVDPTEWLLLVPLLLVVCAVGAWRHRRVLWLAPAAAVGALYVFLVWAYWADRDPISFVLATSAYRVVDPLVLSAAVLLPLAAERVLRR